jgi:hypothetical protein
MRVPLRSYAAGLTAALALVFVIGCSQLPTAPSAANEPTVTTAARSTEQASLLGIVGDVLNPLVKLLVRTLSIVGNLGGTLTNGRWTVTLPAGAVDGSATISVAVPGLTSPACDLGITPADKNHFAVPARLTVDCAAVPLDQLRSYVIYWYDPSTRTWVPVAGSSVDLASKTVSAPLQHFSTYAVGPSGGRAGW